MASLTVTIQQLARDIVARVESSKDCPTSFCAILGELETALSPLVGLTGYYALLARAFSLTSPKYTWLAPPKVDFPDRSLPDWFATAIQDIPTAEATACFSDVLAHLIALLCDLIGENLTFRLINRTWPVRRNASGPTDIDGASPTRSTPGTDDHNGG